MLAPGTGHHRHIPAPATPRSSSPLEEALGRIGDRWTLLIVAGLLDGPRRFGELARTPGLAPNILSARLKHLERAGLVVTAPYCRRPLRLSYQLSATGSELAGALRLLAQWGAGNHPGADAMHHRACGTPMEARWYCPTCARPVDPDEAEDDLYHL